ncbi:dopamine receptor 2-like [Tetranychus urticae]|uniref:G-protein coupled receptors family 1 profile domain-containing protein n=1 Tax=Tetranychus urticae TaxID=32264 RepID=T1JSJ3_TETUR|nr:dopamine receptor 2-like [Tetranychus urticae]XP_025016822.1 dopamine receptor 2-like [Tetranychus urticae]
MSGQVNIGHPLSSKPSDLTSLLAITASLEKPFSPSFQLISDNDHHEHNLQEISATITTPISAEVHSTTIIPSVISLTTTSNAVQIAVNVSSLFTYEPTNKRAHINSNYNKSSTQIAPIFISSSNDGSPLVSLFETNATQVVTECCNVNNLTSTFSEDDAKPGIGSNLSVFNFHDLTSVEQLINITSAIDQGSLLENWANQSLLITNWTTLFNDTINLSFNSTLPSSLSPKNIITANWTTEPDLRIHHPFLALLLAIICLLVIFGNILIMVAIRRERYLHTVTNLFVASLAVADCLVGAIVMPSSVVHEVMNKWWIFGQDWCDLWHSFDVLASTASILNLCVISLDRYWAITDPISYPARMTTRKAKILIALVWTCSAIISFPAIIWWRAVSAPPRPLRCDFTEDIGYLLFSSIISFYGPLIIMLVVYFRIYRAAINQTKSVKSGTKSIAALDGNENNAVVLRIHRGGGGGGGGNNININNSGIVNCYCDSESHPHHAHHYNQSNTHSHPVNHLKSRLVGEVSFEEPSELINSDDNCLSVKVSSVRHRNMKAFSLSRKLAKLAKEKKAAKTLGIVMGVFILCWLPFFIANLVKGFCGDVCLINPDLVYPLVTWLGWLNSGMNPVIYACWSRDFRRAFKKILCSWYKPKSNRGTKILQRPAGTIQSTRYIVNDNSKNSKNGSNDIDNNDNGNYSPSDVFKAYESRKYETQLPKCPPDSIGMISLTSASNSSFKSQKSEPLNGIFYLSKK